MTWQGLLARLKAGAGAVVLGDYGKLPRWYGRWDRPFWNGKGKTDNHALYVERYDARRGRVWMMDPLGRGTYAGEWISTTSLYRFAWFRGGRVQAVATPTARPAPYKGVSFGNPTLASSDLVVTAAWPLRTPRGWHFAGADVHATITPADDPLRAAVLAVDAGTRATAAAPPSRAIAREALGTLTALAPVPASPGAWMVTLALTDRRFGKPVAAAGPVVAFVPGARRATLHLRAANEAPAAGATVAISVVVTNSGGATWADPRPAAAAGVADLTPRATRLVATWIRVDAATGATAGDPIAEGVGDRARKASTFVSLRPVPVDPGETIRVNAAVQAPEVPGRWALVIDVTDDIEGSFATTGSRPAVALLEVVAAVPPAAGLDVD
jgi:hypothetical protein